MTQCPTLRVPARSETAALSDRKTAQFPRLSAFCICVSVSCPHTLPIFLLDCQLFFNLIQLASVPSSSRLYTLISSRFPMFSPHLSFVF